MFVCCMTSVVISASERAEMENLQEYVRNFLNSQEVQDDSAVVHGVTLFRNREESGAFWLTGSVLMQAAQGATFRSSNEFCQSVRFSSDATSEQFTGTPVQPVLAALLPRLLTEQKIGFGRKIDSYVCADRQEMRATGWIFEREANGEIVGQYRCYIQQD